MSGKQAMVRVRFILLGLSFVLALGAAALLWQNAAEVPVASEQNAAVGGPFTLIDQNGQARHDADFRGHWRIVYFGYTFCPDVCPTTLQEIADALHALGADAGKVVPIFITLDPARDKPAILKKYLAAFGSEFVGLTGSPAQIAEIARAYHVYYAKDPLPGGGYSVDHASTLYLMAPDGRFVSLLDASAGAPALAQQLRSRL